MHPRDRDLLVEIRVPIVDGWEGSTGYPVARDRILTACHGLYPTRRLADRPIKLRWFHQSGAAGAFIELSRDAIVWENAELDAALLACTLPETLVDWRHLSSMRPIHNEPWSSEGFPVGADVGGQPTEGFPIKGTLHGAATAVKRFHLELPPAFKSPKSWAGVSGAPVFVRGQIARLIVSTPTTADGRLKAVFSADLFAANGFAEHLGYDRGMGLRSSLRAAAAMCLSDSEDACLHLSRALGCAKSSPQDLASCLLELPTADTVIARLRAAHAQACAARQPQAAAVIRRLVLIALPARFDAAIVEAIRLEMGDPARSVLTPALCTGTGVELAMAAVDGQPAAFADELEDDPYPYPDGKPSLGQPPNCGMADAVEDGFFQEAWKQHLINKFITDRRLKRFGDDALLDIVRRRLQVGEDQTRHRYVLLYDEGHDDDNAIASRRAGLVRAGFPSLVFLQLSNDDSTLVTETALLDPFCILLKTRLEPHP
jgi:hypothetical protein